MKPSHARMIAGALARRASLGVEDVREVQKKRWSCCVCGQQTTRRKLRNGKEIVLCGRCDVCLTDTK